MSKIQFKESPFKVIVALYSLIMLAFTGLFMLSFSNVNSLSFEDALFLSSSALSGTGLSTFNISEELTFVGQFILMIELQLGGIGIMATLSIFLLLFKDHLSISQQTLMSFDQNQKSLKSIKKLMLFIIIYSLGIELIGFLFVFPVIFESNGDLSKSIFISAFHSVSSFTNSGFDLFGNSLIGYNTSAIMILTTVFLIMFGSIGFPTIWELIFSKGKKKSLFFKVNLIVYFGLLFLGFITVLIFEFSNSFSDFSLSDKILNSLFVSTSARNAGIASVDNALLSPSTLLIVMLLMFIGGSPSSCGGGIRTTTFGVLFAKIISTIKGEEEVVVFKKSLHNEDVNKSIVVTFFFFFIFFISTIVLTFVEQKPMLDISYEVMSALTTTGLSTGITASLTLFSKIWLSLIMIIARIGVISLIYTLITPKKSNAKYMKEHLIVG